MLFRLSKIDSWTLAELYGKPGSPTTEEILRCDEQLFGPESPPHAAPAAPLIPLGERPSTDIAIIDVDHPSYPTSLDITEARQSYMQHRRLS